MQLKLNDNCYLTTEPHNRGFRLIVTNNGIEVACRKETKRNLSEFLAQNDASIFKGRLQLVKLNNTIVIKIKGINIGIITNEQLNQLLQ